jgi:hypothetical protein
VSKLEIAAAVATILAAIPLGAGVRKFRIWKRKRLDQGRQLFLDIVKIVAYCDEFPGYLRKNWRRGPGPNGAGIPNFPYEVPNLTPHGRRMADRERPIHAFYMKFSKTRGFVGNSPEECIEDWNYHVRRPLLDSAEARCKKVWPVRWHSRWSRAHQEARLLIAKTTAEHNFPASAFDPLDYHR